jgi:hypothetical protein
MDELVTPSGSEDTPAAEVLSAAASPSAVATPRGPVAHGRTFGHGPQSVTPGKRSRAAADPCVSLQA